MKTNYFTALFAVFTLLAPSISLSMHKKQIKKLTTKEKKENFQKLSTVFHGIEKTFGKQVPFVLKTVDGSTKTFIKHEKLLISKYFQGLFRNKKFTQPHERFVYTFTKDVAPETVKLIGSYFKYHGTQAQQTVEKTILNSEHLIEIYHRTAQLHITPLLTLLDQHILQKFAKKGIIPDPRKLSTKQFEQLINKLDTYLAGRLDNAMTPFKSNPNYFDWDNPTIIQHKNCVNHVTFSPDSRYLATASSDTTCKIYDLKNNQTITIIQHKNWVNHVTFSPDSRYLATASSDTTCKIYDLKNNQTITIIQHKNWVNHVTFSPDSRYLATASNDHTCKIYDLQNNKIITTIQHNGPVFHATFSPDSRYLATASNDHTCKIYDLQNNQIITTIQHKKWVNHVTFSPDSRYLATASDDNTCKIYDLQNNKIITTIQHNDSIKKVTFSPDSRYLVTASSDTTCKIYDLKNNQTITTTIQHKKWVNHVTFSHDNRYLATASSDNTCKIYSTNNKFILEKFYQQHLQKK